MTITSEIFNCSEVFFKHVSKTRSILVFMNKEETVPNQMARFGS
jgi:hypothetical protein